MKVSRTSAVTVFLALVWSLPATAGTYATSLQQCLADNTTGKDRKELARWIFAAMATHPEMRDLSNATELTRDRLSQSMGALLTRLLTENCAEQTRAAVTNEGSQGLEAAFGALGQLAMQELMTNKDVSAALSGFERFVDQKKIQATFAAP